MSDLGICTFEYFESTGDPEGVYYFMSNVNDGKLYITRITSKCQSYSLQLYYKNISGSLELNSEDHK